MRPGEANRGQGGGSRPVYVRALRLRHVSPGPLASFALFEGSLVLGALLALAELVSWWAVAALPLVVAGAVKLNDVVAGALREPSHGYQGVRRSSANRRPARNADRRPARNAERRPARNADRRPGGSAERRPTTSADEPAVGRARPVLQGAMPEAGPPEAEPHPHAPRGQAVNEVSPIGFAPPERGPVFRATAGVGGVVPWPPSEEVDAPVSPGFPVIRRSDWPVAPREGGEDRAPLRGRRSSRGNQGRFKR